MGSGSLVRGTRWVIGQPRSFEGTYKEGGHLCLAVKGGQEDTNGNLNIKNTEPCHRLCANLMSVIDKISIQRQTEVVRIHQGDFRIFFPLLPGISEAVLVSAKTARASCS
ncbi:hypothetical protein SERLA73DRAFT_120937 [Serpula lacrymans var. lacrymans S7.3]|uniref:Uncharacterized protein n=2 Tax=Serpula lacrymans var. lacrymans TaxID=341189 RepID=F8PR40_SERL3|nr:uncharacterized protein SERLADRAFT_367628 [Serpula lacrymans var. lacrymans S7.9]EGO02331.1 hypothetical protein SERLA73DRAFT_120937 [Serpula lacrymans var. lacrymans S7.3]EGO28065.1 hypothetical protein SERLADRAFT_367628 [Serpula lacrymans var. lacrymans S7.9]